MLANTIQRVIGRSGRRFALLLTFGTLAFTCFGESHGNAIATYVLPSGLQAIAYIDVKHHVDQVFYQSNQWLCNDLTANTNTPVAMDGSALATYVLPNGVQAIAYIDNNRHIDQLFYQSNRWLWNDLTAVTGSPLPVLGSSLASYVLPNSVQAIAYTDQSRHVDQLFYQSSTWQFNDLTANTGAPLALTQTAMATYVLPNAVQAIAYIDQISHVDQVFYQSNRWNINDLTAFVGAPVAAAGSGLATYVLPNAVQAIAYLDNGQNVDQLFYQGSQWLFNNLTAAAGAPPAASGSYLATYVLPSGLQAIAFLDNKQNVDQLFYQNNAWIFNDLTPFANAPVALQGSSLATYVLPNGVQAIVFLDDNHHLDQIFFQNNAWQFNDLTSAASAPTPLAGPSLSPQAPAKEYIYFGAQPIATEYPN